MIVLASASPRRRDLLQGAGLAFEIEPAHVDETPEPGLGPVETARSLALRKALHVAQKHSGVRAWVIGADTIVAVPGGESGVDLDEGAFDLLGKPTGPEEASRMLAQLAGTRHLVCTGLAVVCSHDLSVFQDGEETWVTMRHLEATEIEAYVASGEWRDKAGGYGIQDSAEAFVTSLEGGGFDNVVGLPVERTMALLTAAGACGPGGARIEFRPQSEGTGGSDSAEIPSEHGPEDRKSRNR